MKWTMRYAALLAALVLALGLVSVMRPDVATANEDVEMLPHPGDKGDPDSGGTSQSLTLVSSAWLRVWTRTLSLLRLEPIARQANGSRSMSSPQRVVPKKVRR